MQPFYMDNGSEMSGEEVRGKFLPRIKGTRPEKCFIAELDCAAYGYIQAYPNKAFEDICALIGESEGISIDYFIGDARMLGKGLGSEMLRAFQCRQFPEFFPGYSAITLHHDMANAAALRCSLAAGFQAVRPIKKNGTNQLVLSWSNAKS